MKKSGYPCVISQRKSPKHNPIKKIDKCWWIIARLDPIFKFYLSQVYHTGKNTYHDSPRDFIINLCSFLFRGFYTLITMTNTSLGIRVFVFYSSIAHVMSPSRFPIVSYRVMEQNELSRKLIIFFYEKKTRTTLLFFI